MRAIVTGQVGVDKGPYLEAVKQSAAQERASTWRSATSAR